LDHRRRHFASEPLYHPDLDGHWTLDSRPLSHRYVLQSHSCNQPSTTILKILLTRKFMNQVG
jgi:hypothetical protein